jgi:hypothetical protein
MPMSHDIMAKHENIRIAHLSRGASNPLNQVIYLALGVYEQAYNGCSGNGVRLEITLDQFEAASEILQKKNFLSMERPRNMSDDLLEMYQQAGATVVDMGQLNKDILREKEFIERCLYFMYLNDFDKLDVFFG